MRRGLTLPQTFAVVGVGVSVFLLIEGPIWRETMDIVDRAIWWSYLLMPLFVLVVLTFTKRLNLTNFVFGSVETIAYKFGITYLLAHALWALTSAPHARPALPLPTYTKSDRPPPSAIDPKEAGIVRGRAPIGALVFIERGLDHLNFAPIERPLLLEHDGTGFSPRVSAVQAGQEIEVVSRDGRVHTMRATDERGMHRRNIAVLPSLSHAPAFERAFGRLHLDCTIHGGTEQPAELIVLGHPFFARIKEDGAFSFAGVPAGKLRIAVVGASGTQVEDVELTPGATLELSFD